jgi:ABC-type polysaccharide transport system permease subunit
LELIRHLLMERRDKTDDNLIHWRTHSIRFYIFQVSGLYFRPLSVGNKVWRESGNNSKIFISVMHLEVHTTMKVNEVQSTDRVRLKRQTDAKL